MNDAAQCGRCGAPVEARALFCGRCGVDVTLASGDQPTVAMTTGGSPVEPGVSGMTLRTRLREATLGEYEILDELGRGGMATVFRAHDISLDRKVAIKVMAPHLLEGEGMAERFKLEARTAAQLSHPHIIPIYAVKESAATLFFVMKYVEGRALDEIIARTGQLPIAMVKDILVKVGGALGYAHRRGVVHRDIKPGNIMIDDEGTPIVTDFGIAKVTAATTGLTVTGTTIGTPSYMSPEQCEAKEVTGASDQYSLGIVAFQMLTGRLPFEGDSAVTVMFKHCHEDLPPLQDYRPDCPPDILETVTRMVAKDPAERWPSMEAAIQKLSLGASSEAYLDPIRKELVKAAREGDFERLAELSTGGRTPAGSATADAGATTTGAAAGGSGTPAGGRRWAVIAGVVALAGAVATVAVLQPWAGDAASPVEASTPDGANGAVALDDGSSPATDAQIPSDGRALAGGAAGGEPTNGSPGGESQGGTPVGADDIDADPAADDPGDAGAPTNTPPPTMRVRVSEVRISGVPAGLTVGETVVLSATALDAAGSRIPDATVEQCRAHGWAECGIRWAAEPSDVVSVSADGRVTARSAGTASVSATIGGETRRELLTVSAVAAARVAVSPTSLRLAVGDRQRVEAEARDASDDPLRGRPAAWTSADPRIATVNASGQVDAVAPGRTSVSATVDGASGSVEVVVVEEAATAVPRLVEEFAAALAREDLAAAKRLFPTMEQDREEGFAAFFSQVAMQDVRLTAGDLRTGDDNATAVLRGVYVVDDRVAGRTEFEVVINAGFALTPDGTWRITRWDQQGG